MKLKLMIVFIMILCLLISSCNVSGTSSMKTVTLQADHIIFDNASDLANKSDLIIIGKQDINLKDIIPITIKSGEVVDTDFSSGKSVTVLREDGSIEDQYTIIPFKIQKIIKGSFEGKEIKVLQPFAIMVNSDGTKTKFTYEGYSEIQNGDKYIIFLRKAYSYDDVYSIVSLDQGKFNIDGLDQEEQKVQTKQAKDLKDQVMKKFSNELQ